MLQLAERQRRELERAEAARAQEAALAAAGLLAKAAAARTVLAYLRAHAARARFVRMRTAAMRIQAVMRMHLATCLRLRLCAGLCSTCRVPSSSPLLPPFSPSSIAGVASPNGLCGGWALTLAATTLDVMFHDSKLPDDPLTLLLHSTQMPLLMRAMVYLGLRPLLLAFFHLCTPSFAGCVQRS